MRWSKTIASASWCSFGLNVRSKSKICVLLRSKLLRSKLLRYNCRWNFFIYNCRWNFFTYNCRWNFFIYSWPSLVVPYSEELFSRLFLDENQFWWVLQNRMSTENAVGCLFCLSRSLCLQFQQNTMVPVDVDGQISHFYSQGFVPWCT